MANVGHTGDLQVALFLFLFLSYTIKFSFPLGFLEGVLGLLCYVWRKVNQRVLLWQGKVGVKL